MERPRIILHVDMDAFYASIEQRDDPSLRGKPVIVGATGRRGVVSTCSYEARVFGVRSAMPGFRAHELCPQGIFLKPRIGYYAEVSRQIMAVFDRYSPSVEPLSLDEAFLDMTGSERLFGTPREMCERLKADVRAAVDLPCSVGAAATKYVAKVASDVNKPNGIAVCEPGAEATFLAPLPIERLWGVGPRTAQRMRALGLTTIGQVAAAPLDFLQRQLGSLGDHVHQLALGHDPRTVEAGRERKSVGAERTLGADIRGREAVRERLVPLADEVAATLRSKGLKALGVRLKLRYSDFRLVTRDLHLDAPVDEAAGLIEGLEHLLGRAELNVPIRLVGLSAFDFAEGPVVRQLDLFGAPTPEEAPTAPVEAPRRATGSALDRVHEKFGREALVRGSLLSKRPRSD